MRTFDGKKGKGRPSHNTMPNQIIILEVLEFISYKST